MISVISVDFGYVHVYFVFIWNDTYTHDDISSTVTYICGCVYTRLSAFLCPFRLYTGTVLKNLSFNCVINVFCIGKDFRKISSSFKN